MRPAFHLRVVAVIGMRHPEFVRLLQIVSNRCLPVRFVYGGHISDGSNARRSAEHAADGADLVLWNPNGARKFGGGYLPHLVLERVHGVSSAMTALDDWLGAQRRRLTVAC